MNIPGAPPLMPPEPMAQSSVSRLRWMIHLVLLGAYPLLIGLAGLGGGELRGPALTSGARGLIAVCVVQMVIFGFVFGLAWLASRASCDDLLCRWRGGVWVVPLGIGYSLAIRLVLGMLVLAVGVFLVATQLTTVESLQSFFTMNRPKVETIVDMAAMREDPLYFWLTLTLVSFVVAGLREELWRSAFLAGLKILWPRRFASRGGQVAGVAVGAVIFGLAHLAQGTLMAVVAGLLGFMLGLIMVLHRSIWPAVIAHGMFDATSLGLLPWAMDQLQKVQ